MYHSCILFIYLFQPAFYLLLNTFCFISLQKLQLRKSALERSKSIIEEKKSHWRKVLIKDFMSSEDSGKETLEDGSECPVLYIRPLPWRSIQVTTAFHRLDEKLKSQKSRTGIQQTLVRKVGDVSNRSKPAGYPSQFWAFDN